MRPSFSVSIADLVALADFAEHVPARHAAVLEDELAGAARADAELVFLLADGESRESALDEKRGDAAVAGLRIERGEDDEDVGFVGVGDPQLASGDDVVVAVLAARVVSAKASLPEPASDSA